ncbi:MAG: DUF4388 domain-containing protein, partial [Anaerolineae bacterium]
LGDDMVGEGSELTHNDLLVLGMLLDRPMHGYEIVQALRTAEMDLWFPMSPAAVYYSLEKLHRRGLILGSQARGRGSGRTIYYPTDRGREVFFSCLESALTSREAVRFDYYLGILLLNKLPQERAQALLERRQALFRRWEQELATVLQRAGGDPLRTAILKRITACIRLEQEWLVEITRYLQGEEIQEYRGLMVLTGNLRDFHLPDLLKLIASGRLGGTLVVTDGVVTRTIAFHSGQPECATSWDADGQRRDPAQIMDDVCDLFRWQEGTFTFDQRPRIPDQCTPLRIRIEDLLLAGARWVDNWATIQRIVPTSEVVFERRDRELPEGIELTDDERRVWEALDGVQDVTEIARTCALTEFETSKILYTLHVVGLIRPGEADKVRLRRCFREIAELLCRATIPARPSPDDLSCEEEVSRCCADLPIRFNVGRIEDRTDPALPIRELADIYRRFLQTQQEVLRKRFGEEQVAAWRDRVMRQIGPGLQDVVRRYHLL